MSVIVRKNEKILKQGYLNFVGPRPFFFLYFAFFNAYIFLEGLSMICSKVLL